MNKQKKCNIPPDMVERILEKIGLNQWPEISESGLVSVYQAWCRTVPFDNIKKLMTRHHEETSILSGSTPIDFFSHWLDYGIGGTCWAGNGALYTLLSDVGFKVNYAISTMLSPLPQSSFSPGHGTLIVDCDHAPFIIDATLLHHNPLPLKENQVFHPVWGTTMRYEQEHWLINWKPLGRPRVDCRLLDFNSSSEEFALRQTLSKEHSRFNDALLIRIAGNNAIYGLVKGEKVIRHSDGVESVLPLEQEQQLKMLIEHFHIAESIAMAIPRDKIVTHK